MLGLEISNVATSIGDVSRQIGNTVPFQDLKTGPIQIGEVCTGSGDYGASAPPLDKHSRVLASARRAREGTCIEQKPFSGVRECLGSTKREQHRPQHFSTFGIGTCA